MAEGNPDEGRKEWKMQQIKSVEDKKKSKMMILFLEGLKQIIKVFELRNVYCKR